MKMNRIEKFAMNNPVRAFIQRHFEAPLLERLGGRADGQRVLEIGCGQGVGTELIFNRFGAKEVCAYDIDPEMIKRASHRLAHYMPDRLKFTVSDVSLIDEANESFDTAFDFWIIHHVPEWQTVVTEIYRLLKPGGKFFFAEVTSHALQKWSYRTFLEHPQENRFSGEEFVNELERQGINVGNNWVSKFSGDFIFGVGQRAE